MATDTYENSYEYRRSGGSIWSTISENFSLDHRVQSSRVQAEIRKLLAEREKFYSILVAATPYIHYIFKEVMARGLPAELALIPIIESEFNPNDKSKRGATGLWQLMPGTARELGIKVKSNYDGRRNVIDSTRAATAYFKDLGVLFKDNWHLAIAAYNCGQGKVLSAIKRKGSKNYWNLSVPKETKLYVPRLLAIAAIMADPEKYGFELPEIDNKPFFTRVDLEKPVSLNKIAKSIDVDMELLHKLNPDYKKPGVVTADKKGNYKLLVPADKDVSSLAVAPEKPSKG